MENGFMTENLKERMLDEIEAIIFDLDGTLIDSMNVWSEIDQEYMAKLGIPIPADLRNDIEGMGFAEVAVYFQNRFHIQQSVKEITDEWHEMAYDKYAKEIRLKPGAGDFLRDMKKRDRKLGIATSNSRQLLKAVLVSNGVDDLFDAFCTSDEVNNSKPAPDVYLKVADKLNVSPESCLVFEDIPQGIMAGKNAGMRVCAVEDNFSMPVADLKKDIADYYIKSFYDIV